MIGPPTPHRRHLAALPHHRPLGHKPPTRAPLVRDTLAGRRRELGTAPRQVAPLLADDVRALLATLVVATSVVRSCNRR